MPSENETPTNPIDRIDPTKPSGANKNAILEECVVCGEDHTHGFPKDDPSVGDTGQRTAHCKSWSGDYVLEVTEDTEIDL